MRPFLSGPGDSQPWLCASRRASPPLRCALCGGRREVIAQLTDPAVVRAILTSLGLPTTVPVLHPARGPPGLFDEEVGGEGVDDGDPGQQAAAW